MMAAQPVHFEPWTGLRSAGEERADGRPLEARIIAALKTIYDPEIPVNLYDLGLIYDISIDNHARVAIRMTLTSPACPVAGSLPCQVEQHVREVAGVSDVGVELVWDPPWSKDRMSEAAQLELGIF